MTRPLHTHPYPFKWGDSNAYHFGLMDGVDLVLVMPLLRIDSMRCRE